MVQIRFSLDRFNKLFIILKVLVLETFFYRIFKIVYIQKIVRRRKE